LQNALKVLCCPRCRRSLEGSEVGLTCGCGAVYRVDRGVIRFVSDDAFYEGTYAARIDAMPGRTLRDRLAFHIVNTHYLSWVRRHVPKGGRLLELGCGGGVRFFAEHARTTALDLSFGSLQRLDPRYELAVQADALALPFADETFDAAASAYFYEHLEADSKERLLPELRRVLKPGGRVVFLFDVLSGNPLFRFYRKDPVKFRECFIEHDHHYGLEPSTVNVARFERHGFRVRAAHLANKTPIQQLAVYTWSASYGTAATRALSRFAEVVSRRSALNKGYFAGVTLFDDLVEPLLPKDWARIMRVALERE
jgi:SAM-dependent methyltransferase